LHPATDPFLKSQNKWIKLEAIILSLFDEIRFFQKQFNLQVIVHTLLKVSTEGGIILNSLF